MGIQIKSRDFPRDIAELWEKRHPDPRHRLGLTPIPCSVGKSQVTSGFVASNHGYLVITKLRGYLAT